MSIFGKIMGAIFGHSAAATPAGDGTAAPAGGATASPSDASRAQPGSEVISRQASWRSTSRRKSQRNAPVAADPIASRRMVRRHEGDIPDKYVGCDAA